MSVNTFFAEMVRRYNKAKEIKKLKREIKRLCAIYTVVYHPSDRAALAAEVRKLHKQLDAIEFPATDARHALQG